MEFDNQYYKAREAAGAWLNKEPRHRNYQSGIEILERMRFKPLLCRRLRMHPENALTRNILTQALRDGANVCRNPSNPKYADTIPAELEVADGGAHQSVSEEKRVTVEMPSGNYPKNVQTVYRWFAKAYKERDQLHRELRGVGETNDSLSMERRKELLGRIDYLSDYMDRLYQMREAYQRSGIVPTDDELEAASPNQKATEPEPAVIQGEASSSLRKKSEDFSSMGRDELTRRIHSLRTGLTKKTNMLRYQKEGKKDKENPMPPCPKRTKIETQVRILEEKLYQARTALALLG